MFADAVDVLCVGADPSHAVLFVLFFSLLTMLLLLFALFFAHVNAGDVDGIRQAAKEVSDFLGTVHHNYEYTVQEGLDAIREVSFWPSEAF